MGRKYRQPAEISDVEWMQLRAAFSGDGFADVVTFMRQKVNVPQRACDLPWERHHIDHGEEQVNTVLRQKKLPFVLLSIGSWRKGGRRTRLLAFVRRGKKPPQRSAPANVDKHREGLLRYIGVLRM